MIRVLAFAILVLISAAFAGEEIVIDGVLHVRNGPVASQGTETVHLEELWRVGGEDDETIFGLITSVHPGSGGNIYLLDAQMCEILVYSPEGEHVKTFFREGEGPGETLRPRDMLLFEDGSVGVIQEFPGKMTIVDSEGNPKGSINAGGSDPTERTFVSLIACSARAGNMVLAGTRFRESDTPGIQRRTNFLSSYSMEGEELVRYMEAETEYNFADFVFKEREHVPHFWWGFAIAPDGRVYVTRERDRYAIVVFNPDGTQNRVIEREFDQWQRTDQDRKRMTSLLEGATAGVPGGARIEIEDAEPVVAYFNRGIHVAPDGSLWVLTSRALREQAEGIMATYDVFDTEGHLVKQVRMACEGNPRTDGLFLLDNDRVLLVKGYLDALAAQFGRAAAYEEGDEEPALMEVIYYTAQR